MLEKLNPIKRIARTLRYARDEVTQYTHDVKHVFSKEATAKERVRVGAQTVAFGGVMFGTNALIASEVGGELIVPLIGPVLAGLGVPIDGGEEAVGAYLGLKAANAAGKLVDRFYPEPRQKHASLAPKTPDIKARL